MRAHRQLVYGVGVLLGALIMLTGCPSDSAIQRLSLAEQAELYTYHNLMTGPQELTYLSKATAAERTAYLSEIGLAQRFQALDSLDREAVKNGWPSVGMSTEALLFVWGYPVWEEGDARRDSRWHYLGSSFGRGGSHYNLRGFGNRVIVTLVAGKVVAWVDVVPSVTNDAGDSIRR